MDDTTKARVIDDLKIYGIMQRKIKDFQEQIKDVELAGIAKSSKDITSFNGKDGYVSDTPEMIKVQSLIKHLENKISMYKLECVKIRSALRTIEQDEFYNAFYDIYVSGKTFTDIAKYKAYINYHINSVRYHTDKLLVKIGQELYATKL